MRWSRWAVAPTVVLVGVLAVACGSQTVPDPGATGTPTHSSVPAHSQPARSQPNSSIPARFGPDGSGSFTGLGATSLVDTDGDGKADAFRVPIEVTVSNPGTWSISLDLSQGGQVVLSAPGAAELPSGAGVINVDVSGDNLLIAGVDGVFEVTNVVLADWTDVAPRFAAQVDSLGRTGALRLSDITLPPETQPYGCVSPVLLSHPTANYVDTDKDGRFDILRFSGQVNVERAGAYLLSAWLVGPKGQLIATHEEALKLTEGRPTYRVDFPGELVGAYGSGRYTMSSLRVTLVSAVECRHEVKAIETDELKASQWIGGQPNAVTLLAMWQAAQDIGGIKDFGLFVRELHRLERVERFIDTDDLAAARGELDLFLSNVRQEAGIDRSWRDRVVDYATKVRGVL